MTKALKTNELTSHGRRLLREVYAVFRETGNWPKLREMQRRFGRADVRQVVEELGHERAFCNGTEEPFIALRLAGLEAVREATSDRETYARAVGLMAQRYEAGADEVAHMEFATALGLDDLSLSRLGHILQIANSPTRGGSYNPTDGSFSMRLDGEAHFYLGAMTYAKVKQIRRARVAAQEQRHAQYFGPQRESSAASTRQTDSRTDSSHRLRLTNLALDKVLQHDLQELGVVHQAGAWKATALLAGSCLEAVLLDMLERRPEEAQAILRNEPEWRSKVGLEGLAAAAAKLGMITIDMQQFAVAAKGWRDIIHPARAVRSQAPSKELAEALVANLRLLLARLTTQELASFPTQ